MAMSREEKIALLSSRQASSAPLTREEKLEKLRSARNEDSPSGSSAVDAAVQSFGNGAALGYAPQLQALAEKPLAKVYDAVTGNDVSSTISDDYVDRRDSWAKRQADLAKANPGTSAVAGLAGGLASGIATGPLFKGLSAAAPAATKVGQVANAMKAGAKTGVIFGALQNPGEVEGELSPVQLGSRLDNAEMGLVIGGAIPIGFEGVRAAGRGAKVLADAVKTGTVKGAEQIKEAARRLGVTLTPGMTSDSMAIRGLESSLEQSPTLGGAMMRKQTGAVRSGVENNVEGLLSERSSLSGDEAGRQIKSGVLSTLDEKLQPSRDTFNSVRESTKEIGVNPKSIARVAGSGETPGSIARMRQVDLGLSGSDEAAALSQRLQKAKTIDDLKLIRTDLGRKLSAASEARDPSAPVLSDLYQKVARLEESNLLRQGVEQARAGGVTPAKAEQATKQLLNDLRGAKKGFSQVANEVRDFAAESSLPKWASKSPDLFTSAIDGLQNEKVVKTLFDTGNVQALKQFQKTFPNEFDVARRAYLQDLAAKAESRGATSTGKFLQGLKDMQPEVRKMIFGGEGASKISDLKTLMNAIPERIGPSGTPQGLEFTQAWRPDQQLASLARYGAYKGLTSNAFQNAAAKVGQVGQSLADSPVLKQLAEKNPAAFTALMTRLATKQGKFTEQVDDPGAKERLLNQR